MAQISSPLWEIHDRSIIVSEFVGVDRFEVSLAHIAVLNLLLEAMLREQCLHGVSGRLVTREEDDVVSITGIERLCGETRQRRVSLFDGVLAAIGFVCDPPSGIVHHRRDECIGVVEFVGDDDPPLLESHRTGNIPRGVRLGGWIPAEFSIHALWDQRNTCLSDCPSQALELLVVRTATPTNAPVSVM